MDIYKEVTNRIIAQLENGIIPWKKPWIACGKAVSHVTGNSYSLLNQMLLGRPGEYVTFAQYETFAQCQKEGGRVKKGEKSSMVVFWKFIEQEDEETHEKKQVPFLRYYNVFHIDQCEGLKVKHQQELPNSANADEAADSVIHDYCERSGVRLRHQEGDRAFYSPSSDSITLPLLAQFAETAEYYSTAFHELTHSTGHASRLNRLERTSFFGTEAYNKEELIAEIGAVTLVHAAGLETSSSFRNSTAYIQNWLRVLNDDKHLVVSAAGKAEKAVSLILGQ